MAFEGPREIENKEEKYQQGIKAVSQLYDMSLRNEFDRDKWGQLYEKIEFNKLALSKKLDSDEEFLEVLPIFNKMAQIEKNYEESGALWKIDLIREISSSALYSLSFVLDKLDEEKLRSLGENDLSEVLKTIRLLLDGDIDYQIERAEKFFQKNHFLFEELMQNSKADQLGLAAIEDFLNSREFGENLAWTIQKGMQARKTEKIDYAEPLLKKMVEKYGLSYKVLMSAWRSHEYNGRKTPNILGNIYCIGQIESKKPGIASFLFEKRGIRHFDRYPEELLLDQLIKDGDQEKPYGILINPENDWNGAFSQNQRVWANMYRQIKRLGYNLRIMECSSKQDVARQLISLSRKYGERHKISFAFIGGHGTEKSIKFGGDKERNTLFISDLEGRGVQRTKNFFEPHPTIVLISCSTGAEKGIGYELSQKFGAKVIASKVPTNIREANFLLSGDYPDFNIEYTRSGEAQTFEGIEK